MIETKNGGSLSTMKVGCLGFPGIRIWADELPKVRGYFGGRYGEFDRLHNHIGKTNDVYYRYPVIQFKLQDDGSLSVYGYSDGGITILERMYKETRYIEVGGRRIAVKKGELDLNIGEQPIGEDGNIYLYRFDSPWLALNQSNYKRYRDLGANSGRRAEMLHSILINNIISLSKFSGYTVQSWLKVHSRFREVTANLKGMLHKGFVGDFLVNFMMPDGVGLGKSSSRGFGRVSRLTG